MAPDELAQAAQQEFLWKGVTGIVTSLAVAVVALFGWLMRSKDNHVTRLDSKIELLERQALDRERDHKGELKQLRDEYERKLEQARQEKSQAIRQRSKTARLAEEALAYLPDGTPSDRPPPLDDEEDESTGVHDMRALSREDRVQAEIRRRKEAARREKERIDREARAYVRGESPPPPSVPPPKPYRARLPSRR